MRVVLSSILVVLILGSISNAATLLYFNSEPGDFIGQGIEQTWTTEDGVFTINGDVSSNVVSIDFDGTSWWFLDFAAPSDQTLQVGPYENAARYPFQSPTLPGLDVFGDGRGCNELTGRFDILEISYSSGGEIDRFAADFEQHCEGLQPALYGSIRYNATIGFPLKVDIKANDKDTPVIVNVGEAVEISVSTDAGDDLGILGEYWLGISGSYGSQWLHRNGWSHRNRWMDSKSPMMWKRQSISTDQYTFNWVPKNPGVYLFQFVVDKQFDQKLNTQFVDHIVITVLKN